MIPGRRGIGSILEFDTEEKPLCEILNEYVEELYTKRNVQEMMAEDVWIPTWLE